LSSTDLRVPSIILKVLFSDIRFHNIYVIINYYKFNLK
jgi:hypothetical protein